MVKNHPAIFFTLLMFLSVSAGLLQGQTSPVPYLQSPTDTSIWVSWITSDNTESAVIYGKTSGDLQDTVTGSCQTLSSDFYYHSVQLTGLDPLTFYYYKVKTGSMLSGEYRFRTQPVPGSQDGHYRFLIMGDHQIASQERYEKMMAAAKKKVIEIYDDSVEEAINLLINVGDQVDLGTLDQYRNVHFKKSSLLSPNLPIMTVVGNHETYGNPGLPLYYDFFFYDKLGYKGIPSPGGENYYSFQVGRLLFVMLSSEHPEDAQAEWVQRIVDSVKNDPMVDWVFSDGHRPIQAEQYVGDISSFIRDRIIPELTQTEKAVLHISGHHHLYARGQVHEFPLYHIITGGTAWDQFWGQSHEEDFDDVQKTIANWAYQIVDIDLQNMTMNVKTFSIGGPKVGFVYDNKLIDEFHRDLAHEITPDKPSLQEVEDTITLPYTFISSPYASSGSEEFNSTWFQIAKDAAFDTIETDKYRDFEDLYGTTGEPDYLPVDVNDTVDILKWTLNNYVLLNGTHYIRVRHRDRNLQWSEWSDAVAFVVKGSLEGYPRIYVDRQEYNPDEDITVYYEYTPGNAKDWLGIYRKGDTPGSQPSYLWSYLSGNEGSVVFNIPDKGEYFIALFEDDSYNEIADRIDIYVMQIPEVTTDKWVYNPGEGVTVQYKSAPSFSNDWIGVYKIYDEPGEQGSTAWQYVSGETGSVAFSGLQKGYYFANYFLKNGYSEPGERAYFAIGDDLAVVSVDSSSYREGSIITITYSNAPPIAGNWLGIIDKDVQGGGDTLAKKILLDEKSSGVAAVAADFGAGHYYVRLFFNDTTAAVSNQVSFTIGEVSGIDKPVFNGSVRVFPLPSEDVINIIIWRDHPEDVNMRIFSVEGKEIVSEVIPGFSGEVRRQVALAKYGKGVYFLEMKAGNARSTKKIIIR